MFSKICLNCGAEEGLHQMYSNRCPRGGFETPMGKPQEWEATTFVVKGGPDDLKGRIDALEDDVKRLRDLLGGRW